MKRPRDCRDNTPFPEPPGLLNQQGSRWSQRGQEKEEEERLELVLKHQTHQSPYRAGPGLQAEPRLTSQQVMPVQGPAESRRQAEPGMATTPPVRQPSIHRLSPTTLASLCPLQVLKQIHKTATHLEAER